jgi:hypothetical protein
MTFAPQNDQKPNKHDETNNKDALEALRTLSLNDLRLKARQTCGYVPHTRSKELLILMIAYQSQAKTQGDLDDASKRTLLQNATPLKKPKPTLTTGVKLIKQWQGETIEVLSLDQGRFQYQGQVYPSLSQIATLITGTKWNGPRFFGLREPNETRDVKVSTAKSQFLKDQAIIDQPLTRDGKASCQA